MNKILDETIFLTTKIISIGSSSLAVAIETFCKVRDQRNKKKNLKTIMITFFQVTNDIHLLPTVPLVDFLGGPDIANLKNNGYKKGDYQGFR